MMLAILPKGFKTEMIFSVGTQARLFLCAVVIGALFGVGYELLRTFRRAVRHSDIAVFIEDFLFVTVCAFWYFIFVHATAWGQIRMFIFIGMAGGMALEQLVFGDVVAQSAAVVLRSVFGAAGKIAAFPFKSIVKIAKKLGSKFVQSSKVFKKIKKPPENA